MKNKKKNHGIYIYILCGILLLTSCNTYEYVEPSMGMWQSDSPKITLVMTGEYGYSFGTYV